MFLFSLLAGSASLMFAYNRPIALIKPAAIPQPAPNPPIQATIHPAHLRSQCRTSATRSSIPRSRTAPLDILDRMESKSNPAPRTRNNLARHHRLQITFPRAFGSTTKPSIT